MEEIRTIETFEKAYHIFLFYDYADVLTENQVEKIKAIEDYETFKYAVINGKVYIYDFLSSDVIGKHETINDFINSVMEEITEDE